MHIKKGLCCALLSGIFFANSALVHALVIIPDEIDHTTPGTLRNRGFGWDYVGSMNNASCVFLGHCENGSWFITARHVYNSGPGLVNLNGHEYTAISGSGMQIGGAGITMFRVETDDHLVNLPPIGIKMNMHESGAEICVIGNGLTRNGDTSRSFEVSNTPSNAQSYLGWEVKSGGYEKTWATGKVEEPWLRLEDDTAVFMTILGRPDTYSTRPSRYGTSTFQGQLGDLGGGAFSYNEETLQWDITGIVMATSIPKEEGYAVEGDLTYFANIAEYSTEILTVMATASPIPEPSSGFLSCFSAGILFLRRRRR